MAILKHIASKSSNYGAALEYLIFSGVFSGKTRRMHIQYQRYPAGVAHEIFKVRCDFVRNQEFSEVKPKVNRSV